MSDGNVLMAKKDLEEMHTLAECALDDLHRARLRVLVEVGSPRSTEVIEEIHLAGGRIRALIERLESELPALLRDNVSVDSSIGTLGPISV
jgi:trimethylamine:corrinoid methyltransferase-like protein